MSATRSKLPGGTRLAALIALAITACLFAWRANALLLDTGVPADTQTFQQRQLTGLLEPVFGANNVRVATHAGEEGARQFLVLINSDESQTPIDRTVFERVVTILEASAGYDRGTDNLHIQPFGFAPGTAGGLQTPDLFELGALGLLGLLAGFLVFAQVRPSPQDSEPADRLADMLKLMPASQVMRTSADHAPAANEHENLDNVRELAARDPKAAARIVRRWLSGEGDGA